MIGRQTGILAILSILIIPIGLRVPLTFTETIVLHDIVDRVELSSNSRVIVFDYSHGQFSSFGEADDLILKASLETLGYTIIWARGGLNSTLLAEVDGLILGSILYEDNAFLTSEIQAISDWFDEGLKFLWVGCDSDYYSPPSAGQFINDNMSAILESVGSHVYPEPTHVFDAFSNADAAYRVIANETNDDPFVSRAINNVSAVLMHGPTLLYGSNVSSNPGVGIAPVDLATTTLGNVYPLLYYSHEAQILDSDLLNPFTHDNGDYGSFVAAAIEIELGSRNTSVAVVSGASPYGDYSSMHISDYYDKYLDGDNFVKQTIDFGMSLERPPSVDSPDDVVYEEGIPGNSIEWGVFDMFPKAYNITADGFLIRKGLWNSSEEVITVNVDGLGFGPYSYTLNVTNQNNLSTIDTVYVFVEEIHAPIINQPEDISYYEGETGNRINWTPSDLSLNYYDLYIDGVLSQSHQWLVGEDTTIVIDVDGLSIGEYNYTIRVRDKLLLETTDTVIVQVRAEITTPTSSTSTTTNSGTITGTGEFNLLGPVTIIISVGSLVAIIAVAFLVLRKRS